MAGCLFYPVSAVVEWKDKTSNIIRTRDFSYVTDEPKDDMGNDLGPTPAEMLLWSAAGCVAISIEQIAMHRGIPFSAVMTLCFAAHKKECRICGLRFMLSRTPARKSLKRLLKRCCVSRRF